MSLPVAQRIRAWRPAVLRRHGIGMLASTGFTIGTKAVQAIASFAIVHKLVKLWGLSGYGLWVTLTAFAMYISLFDMGVGYGVKNRISEAWGRGNPGEASDVVRIGIAVYFVASIVALAAGVVVVGLVEPFKDHLLAAGTLWAACVVAFFLSFHNMVLQGLGRFKALALLGLIAPCTWFVVLQAWPRAAAFPLELGAAIYASALVAQSVVIMLASRRVHAFGSQPWYRTRVAEALPLVRTGAQFLVLQLTAFVLYGMGNFLIYRSMGSVDTAQYDAANKVFSIFSIAFSTLITIAWTEISRAKAAADNERLRAVHRLLHAAAFAFIAAAAIACWSSATLTRVLTGVSVPSALTVCFVVFLGVQMLSFASAVFLNAFEQLRVQIIGSVVAIPVFFGTAFALFSHHWGIASVPIASAAAMLPSLAACFLVARRLIARPLAPAAAAPNP